MPSVLLLTNAAFHRDGIIIFRIRVCIFAFLLLAGALYSCQFKSKMQSIQFCALMPERMPPLNSNGSESVCVLARFYGPQMNYFPAFALALQQSGLPRVRLFVINTDAHTDLHLLRQKIEQVNQICLQKDYSQLLNLGLPIGTNDFGYTMTDQALNYFYDNYDRFSSICQYVMTTNADNLYSSNLGTKLLPNIQQQVDVIGWSFISHYCFPKYQESFEETSIQNQYIDDGTMSSISAKFEIGSIDLGAVMYGFALLKAHRFLFKDPIHGYNKESDGIFTVRVATVANSSVLLKQILLIHQ
jgi:hypothetical protein